MRLHSKSLQNLLVAAVIATTNTTSYIPIQIFGLTTSIRTSAKNSV